jgi:hypothetical protein
MPQKRVGGNGNSRLVGVGSGWLVKLFEIDAGRLVCALPFERLSRATPPSPVAHCRPA